MSRAGISGTLSHQKQTTRHSASFSVTALNRQLIVTRKLVIGRKMCRKWTACLLFAFHQQHSELHLLCSDCCGGAEQGSRMIRSVTVATSFHFSYIVPSISLALRLSSLPLCAGGRDALPSRYLCPAMHSEEECCSAMHHMRIALCGMLQITRSVLRGQGSGAQ